MAKRIRRTGGGPAPTRSEGGHAHSHGDHGHAHEGHGHAHPHGGEGPAHAHSRDEDGHPHPGRDYDRHRNPRDLARYLARLEGEDRAGWQAPDRVVKALRLPAGATVCDVGVGPGYFALRMARVVGDRGAVYAIDVEPRMLDILRQRIREIGAVNVRPILARGLRGALPPRRCDLILVVNTFHHFPDGVAYLRRLAGRLAPAGRIVNIDFREGELPVGPPPAHKVSRSDFLAMAGRAGLGLVREHRFLPYQYFLELAPTRRPAARVARPARSAATGAAHARRRR
jgi:ubiquinone/menaquinone biosynthesis C-methylase UbiE